MKQFLHLRSCQLIPKAYCLLAKTYYLIALTILVFVSCSAALAQEIDVHSTPAAQAEVPANKTTDMEITPLKIGDKIPDELWEMYFPVVSANSEQVQYLSFRSLSMLTGIQSRSKAIVIRVNMVLLYFIIAQ